MVHFWKSLPDTDKILLSGKILQPNLVVLFSELIVKSMYDFKITSQKPASEGVFISKARLSTAM